LHSVSGYRRIYPYRYYALTAPDDLRARHTRSVPPATHSFTSLRAKLIIDLLAADRLPSIGANSPDFARDGAEIEAALRAVLDD
jgi:hypothetical protein